MSDRLAELARWVIDLEAETDERCHAVAAAARAMSKALSALPANEYRDMASCKLTDAIAMAAVAARQTGDTP